MLVFLSWSGEKSKAVAVTLKDWLPLVINAVDPWISEDIEKGRSWGPEIKGRLEKSKVGIFCMTAENLVAPWLLVEAGAISRSEDAHVCTLLVGLKPSDVAPPLGTFQHTVPEKADIHRLVQTINRRVAEAGEKGLEDKNLDRAFENYWSELEVILTGIAGPRRAKSSQTALV